MALDTDASDKRVSSSCPADTREILEAARRHDLAALKTLLSVPGKASSQDPITGETPLHAAIRGAAEGSDDAAARAAVHELFLSGAIWNDVDDANETPGCVAYRLGQKELYNLCVEAGVRAELLFALMGGYEELESGGYDDADMDVDAEAEDGEEAPELVPTSGDSEKTLEEGTVAAMIEEPSFMPVKPTADTNVESETYLRSKLTYSDGKLVDDDGNGVMMAWETEIMRRSVDLLVNPRDSPKDEDSLVSGKRILNIGFGMGIIDSIIAATQPAKHHIIEAHPEVLARLSSPEAQFGSAWEARSPTPSAFKVHKGKWQDVCRSLIEAGELYDGIYFDTFGEDYSQLQMFFTDMVPSLLDFDGVFGFFNGLGADRRICYDVYHKVVEMHLTDAGMDVEWHEIPVDMQGLDEEGKGEWEGVKRRYWTLDTYRLPVCTFLG